MHTSGQVVHSGFFGYITHGSVRNLVLDDTCTVSSTYGGWMKSAYMGGLVGLIYYGGDTEVRFENLVNMANIYYDRNDVDKSIGGIVGEIDSINGTMPSKTV